MIRELFIPSVIKGARYFSQKVLGITLEENCATGALINKSPKSSTVEKVFYEKSEENSYDQKSGWNPKAFAGPISKIIKSAEKFDQLIIAIPSSIVVFKELELPFYEREKIKMVVEYEVEQILPFPASEAVIDFISPAQEKGKINYKIIVAATKRSDIQKLADALKSKNIIPNSISIDLFGLHSLISNKKPSTPEANFKIIIDISNKTTKVVMLERGNIRFIRSIQKGALFLIPEAFEAEQEGEFLERLKLYGLSPTGNNEYDEKTKNLALELIREIEFTISSFSMQTENYKAPESLLIFERETPLKGLLELIQEEIKLPTSRISIENFISEKGFKNSATSRASELYRYGISVGVASLEPEYEEFNLGGDVVSGYRKIFLTHQLIATATTIVAIAILIFSTGYMQISSLSSTLENTETSAKNTLKKLIVQDKKKKHRVQTLKRLTADATEAIEKEETAWNRFGCQEIPALETMLELTRTIDRSRFDVTIDKFNMTSDEKGKPTLKLSGSFKAKKGNPKSEFTVFWDQVIGSKRIYQEKPP